MTENHIEERVQTRDDLSSAGAPLELTAAEAPNRRFTVNGFRRVPRAYIPTLAIGALVVIFATVWFVVNILWK
jgi:hypothetical protein